MNRKFIIIAGAAASLPLLISALPVRGHSLAGALGVRVLAAASSTENGALNAPDLQGVLASGADPDLARAGSGRSVDGQVVAHSHRSRVATVADSLLLIAEREDPDTGIPGRLTTVAHALSDRIEPATEAMEKVSYRGAVSAFFFGNSRDLGVVRDAAETERSALDTLGSVRADMTDTTDQAALDTARDALAADVRVLERFIESHS